MSKITILIILITAFFTSSAEDACSKEEKAFAVKAMVGYNIPFGEFSDLWGSGVGLYGVFEYKVTPDIGIGLHIGYQFWEPVLENPNEILLFTDIPIVLEFLYYFEKAKGFRPYAGIEAGFHIITYRPENRLTNIKNNIEETNMGFAPVAGMIVPFGAGVFLDVNIKYTTVLKSDNDRNALRTIKMNIENLSHIGINAGISYPF